MSLIHYWREYHTEFYPSNNNVIIFLILYLDCILIITWFRRVSDIEIHRCYSLFIDTAIYEIHNRSSRVFFENDDDEIHFFSKQNESIQRYFFEKIGRYMIIFENSIFLRKLRWYNFDIQPYKYIKFIYSIVDSLFNFTECISSFVI